MDIEDLLVNKALILIKTAHCKIVFKEASKAIIVLEAKYFFAMG
jgi:hypothetical protein